VVCTYTHTHTHIHTYIHTRTHTQNIHTNTHAHTHTHTQNIRSHAHLQNTHAHTHTHTLMLTGTPSTGRITSVQRRACSTTCDVATTCAPSTTSVTVAVPGMTRAARQASSRRARRTHGPDLKTWCFLRQRSKYRITCTSEGLVRCTMMLVNASCCVDVCACGEVHARVRGEGGGGGSRLT
jgi:hypothetical protein